MVKIYFSIGLFFCAAIFFGCDPYRFSVTSDYPVNCRILSDHNSVKSRIYGFDMEPNAELQVTSLGRTQYTFTGYFTLHGGEGFEIMLRPVIEESVIDPGIRLMFSSHGLRIDSAGQVITENTSYSFPQDSQTYVTVFNEESYLQVTVGCDTVLRRYSKRTASDDIALKTLPASELKVVDPEWKRIKFMRGDEEVVHQVKLTK
jgi:hypothetical protein